MMQIKAKTRIARGGMEKALRRLVTVQRISLLSLRGAESGVAISKTRLLRFARNDMR